MRIEVTEGMINAYKRGVKDALKEHLGREATEEEVKYVILKLAEIEKE